MKNRIKIGLMLGTAGALGWTPAYAQAPAEAQIAPALPQAVAPAQAESTDPASNVGIGDIVVTAQRRAENVQQVPIAVAAFSGAALQEKGVRSEEHTSELQSLMRISYAVFCLKKKKKTTKTERTAHNTQTNIKLNKHIMRLYKSRKQHKTVKYTTTK